MTLTLSPLPCYPIPCSPFNEMKPAGVYIHTPFCRSRCSYCDFATGMYDAAAAERYVRSLVNEITSWGEVETGEPVQHS